jgi:hypothetical protein
LVYHLEDLKVTDKHLRANTCLNSGCFFPLQLAVSNRDARSLSELYGGLFAGTWEVDSFVRLFLLIESEDWSEGRRILFESLTTEIIFRSLSVREQIFLVKQVLRTIQSKTHEAPYKVNTHLLKLLTTEYFAFAVLIEILEPDNFDFYGRGPINSYLKHVMPLLRIKNYLTYKYHDRFSE